LTRSTNSNCQTSTYSAEFGRSLGGVVNLQIKSGSNAMHGSGFEFLRNDAFDANNFFNNRAGRPKPDFSQHQYGGTFGGPIARNRTFVFGAYQGYKINQGATYLSTVPSARMRQGDFSEINRIIYDPLNGQPFPGNVIPVNRFNPTSKKILDQMIPDSNTGGTRSANGQTINNYLINPTLTRQDNQIDTKVDHNLSSANHFFLRYSYQKTHRVLPATLPHGDAGFTFGAGDGNIKAQGLAFNDTHTLSSNLLNEFRAGWSSIKFFMTPIDYGTEHRANRRHPGRQPRRDDVGDESDHVQQRRHAKHWFEWQPAADYQSERLPAVRQRHPSRRQAHHESRWQLYAPFP
jgi:hypothetical protein